ncbi:MAG TPA: tetratricopeptide repeat protein, partial [Anaerolineaceae bacterium]|nr:tetratricopeptide repeat protein [Anaerolineaceae bacterium]
MAENRLLSDVTEALRNGETVKARELLIRLITAEPTVAEYWVWLSSVAATAEDEISYLRQALHIDPSQPDARARLAALGVALPVLPVNPVQAENIETAAATPAALRSIPGIAWLRRQPRSVVAAVLWVGAFVVVVAGFGLGLARRPERMPLPGTAVPSSTYLPTNSPVVRSPTPTYVGPAPLWMRLEATYTPTPVYVQTPHPRSEAYQVGMRRYQQGDLPGLVEYMDQVIFNEPDAADAAYYAGEGWRLQGRIDQALGYYQQAIKINPNFAPAYLGRARAQIALDPLADIQADIDQAFSLDPGYVDTYLFAAEVALGRGDGNTALNMLAQAEQRSGVSPSLLLLRARARLATGEVSLALQDAQEANRLDITLIPAYQTLALAWQANDQPAESI